MKKFALLAAALAIMGMITFTGTASAGVVGAASNCNRHTLLNAGYVRSITVPTLRYGSIQLCRNGDDFFAIYINYGLDQGQPNPPQGPMSSGEFGIAELYRTHSGEPAVKWTCDSPGGNKHVRTGEWWCVTPQIDYRDGDLFKAHGAVDWWDGNSWELAATGWTKWCALSQSSCH